MKQTGGSSGLSVLRYAGPHKVTVILVLLLVMLQVSLGVLLARQLGRLVDVGVLADRQSFGHVFYLLVALWLSSDLALWGRQLLAGRLAENIVHTLREGIARHIGHATIPSRKTYIAEITFPA